MGNGGSQGKTELNQVSHRALGVEAKDLGALEEVFSSLLLKDKSFGGSKHYLTVKWLLG